MKFSILIAHYNNAEYFKNCFESIKNQSYGNWEAIILDDASSDEEKEAIKLLLENDLRFKFYENEKNLGVGFTKAKLIELATGEICGFLDPDDTLHPDALLKSISNYSNKNIATYSQLTICDKDMKPIKKFKNSRSIENNNKLFFNIFFEASHFFTFKKSAYLKTSGINTSLTSAVDQDLYLKLYEIGDFRFINTSLYFYRIHDKGVSQDKTKKNKLNRNWEKVLFDTLTRRNIKILYKKDIKEIENLSELILKNQYTLAHKMRNKLELILEKF